MTYTLERIIAVVKAKGYSLNEEDSKDFNLNIVGIRRNTNVPNSFDDILAVFWKYNGDWTLRTFPCTTDPGTYWLLNPSKELGTAIVKEGQYKKLWKIGLHQGKYKALVQANPIMVIRDFDKDNQLDYDSVKQESGFFGINCHRANENGKSASVDKWSAGCQVLQNREVLHPDYPSQTIKVFEYDYLTMLWDRKVQNWGDLFDYTLINEKDFV